MEQDIPFYLTVPAQLFPEERKLLHDLAAEISQIFPHPTILNIGVWKGGSLHCLRSGAPDATLIGIDIDLSLLIGDPDAILVQADSTRVQFLVPLPVHLIFIDGGHDEDIVLRDIAWTNKIPTGGIVAFHDYYERSIQSSFGVRLAVDKWMAEPGWSTNWSDMGRCKLTRTFRRL